VKKKKATGKPAIAEQGSMHKPGELEQLEKEVKVDAALDKCLVCKRDLVGDVYICPTCKTAKYHGRCVRALIASGEPCWACKHPLKLEEDAS